MGQLTTKVMGEIVARENTIKLLRILSDTGTTLAIILKPFMQTISRYKSVKHVGKQWVEYLKQDEKPTYSLHYPNSHITKP